MYLYRGHVEIIPVETEQYIILIPRIESEKPVILKEIHKRLGVKAAKKYSLLRTELTFGLIRTAFGLHSAFFPNSITREEFRFWVQRDRCMGAWTVSAE